MPRKVTTIPAIRDMQPESVSPTRHRRVAGYARVSTELEEQQNSYEAQVSYYTSYITSKPDWDFVKVYTDEGITGTSIKKRTGFKTMIEDALAGKIDLIITKSVSRFARNTVDSLSTIRSLKEHGVEIFFEKENIWTFDAKGELLITIMSSLAQEESRSISENSKWGIRKRFSDGKAQVAFSRFLGYDRGPDGEFIVNPEEAQRVKRVYALFLDGMSLGGIASALNNAGVFTPSGKGKWTATTVKSILTNEKYCGDALLQKYYYQDYLSKKIIKNRGEVQQYYVEEAHEAIIDKRTFQLTQYLISQMEKDPTRFRSNHSFTGRIKCGECGHWYARKTWHSTDKYKRQIWQCSHKNKEEKKCVTTHLYDEQVEAIFIDGVNRLVARKETILKNILSTLDKVFDTAQLEDRLKAVETDLSESAQTANRLMENNRKYLQDQKIYNEQYNMEVQRYESLASEYEELRIEISDKNCRRIVAEEFLNSLKKQEKITEFSDSLFKSLVDYILVEDKEKAQVVFKNGTAVKVRIPSRKRERHK